MKKIINLLMCIGVMVMFTGCASIISTSQYPVTINSNPSGATLTIKNKQGIDIHKAITPATIMLSAKTGFFNPASYNFQFEKEGYFSTSNSLSAGLDGWYIGNIFWVD